jgi:hypothetical protein
LDYASRILRESTYNQSGTTEGPRSETKATSTNAAFESLLGSIRPASLISRRGTPISNPHDGLEASGKYLCQAHTPCSVDSLIYPKSQSLHWPSIPHEAEAVRTSVIMPIKKPVQHKDVSLTGTDPLHHKPLTGCTIEIDQDFYQRHLPTKPAPIIPRRISYAQPGFIFPVSFNTVTNAPLLLPTAIDSKRTYFQDPRSSSTVNAPSIDDHHSLLPVPVTTHIRQPWIPSLGNWVNSRLSAVLTCTPLGMPSNSDSMEEFLARFSNPEGLHKPWHQILDDLEHDLDPFRAV